MASKKTSSTATWHPERSNKVTSIGHSRVTRYNSKNDKKIGKKLYRGQG